jgi:hypothetical protein
MNLSFLVYRNIKIAGHAWELPWFHLGMGTKIKVHGRNPV